MAHKSTFRIIAILAVLGLFASLIGVPGTAALGKTTTDTKIFMPLVNRQVTTIFGSDATPISSKSGIVQLSNSGASWTRANDLLWAEIEPAQGVYNWGAAKSFEDSVMMSSALNVNAIVNVKGIPAWANTVAGVSCSPIKPESLADFGAFMNVLVARYSKPPFNVKYWEIMNEPDIDPMYVQNNSLYGCWGDNTDPYYGGRYFGEMLKVVYPQVKAADPNAQVLASGFVLDCGPKSIDQQCVRRSRFFEGILVDGAGNSMDAVSFHSYEYYSIGLGRYVNQGWESSWDTAGPNITALTPKANFLRTTMAAFGISKPLYVTELGLLCKSTWYTGQVTNPCMTPEFEQTKADFLVRSMVDGIRNNLVSLIWYKAQTPFDQCAIESEWCYTGIVNLNLTPRLGMNSFTTARQMLVNGKISVDAPIIPGVQAFKFSRGDRAVWVLWTVDGLPQTVNLGATPLAIYDMYGNKLTTASSVDVDFKPVYVEWLR